MKLIWHYARGIAFLRKNNLKDAQEELDAIAEMIKDPALEKLIAAGFDTTSSIAKLAYEVVAGEVAAAKCYDCHGSHNILPPTNPNSTLSRSNEQVVRTKRRELTKEI